MGIQIGDASFSLKKSLYECSSEENIYSQYDIPKSSTSLFKMWDDMSNIDSDDENFNHILPFSPVCGTKFVAPISTNIWDGITDSESDEDNFDHLLPSTPICGTKSIVAFDSAPTFSKGIYDCFSTSSNDSDLCVDNSDLDKVILSRTSHAQYHPTFTTSISNFDNIFDDVDESEIVDDSTILKGCVSTNLEGCVDNISIDNTFEDCTDLVQINSRLMAKNDVLNNQIKLMSEEYEFRINELENDVSFLEKRIIMLTELNHSLETKNKVVVFKFDESQV